MISPDPKRNDGNLRIQGNRNKSTKRITLTIIILEIVDFFI